MNKVEAFSEEMALLATTGVECYQPTYPDLALEEECGVTQVSTENLNKLSGIMGGPSVIQACPKGSIAFWWSRGRTSNLFCPCYLATGFSLGYRGEGPRGLAKMAALMFYENMVTDEYLNTIAKTPADWQGILFCR